MVQLEMFEIVSFLPTSTRTKVKQNGNILLSQVERSIHPFQSKKCTNDQSKPLRDWTMVSVL